MGALTGPGLGKFTCGDLATCSISDLGTADAGDITSGTFGLARIPTMDDAHIPDLETLSYGGTFAEAQIPDLPTTKITEGTFTTARIPILPTDRYGSAVLVSGTRFMEGTFNTGNHPIDDVSKIGFRDIHDVALITEGTYSISVVSKDESLWGILETGHSYVHASLAWYIEDKNAGENLTAGNLVYLKTDGYWWKTDADAVVSTKGLLGLAMETKTVGNAVKVLIFGKVTDAGWSWAVGNPIYVSCTAGGLTQTAPSGSGDQVRKIGHALSSTIIIFNPDATILEIT